MDSTRSCALTQLSWERLCLGLSPWQLEGRLLRSTIWRSPHVSCSPRSSKHLVLVLEGGVSGKKESHKQNMYLSIILCTLLDTLINTSTRIIFKLKISKPLTLMMTIIYCMPYNLVAMTEADNCNNYLVLIRVLGVKIGRGSVVPSLGAVMIVITIAHFSQGILLVWEKTANISMLRSEWGSKIDKMYIIEIIWNYYGNQTIGNCSKINPPTVEPHVICCIYKVLFLYVGNVVIYPFSIASESIEIYLQISM